MFLDALQIVMEQPKKARVCQTSMACPNSVDRWAVQCGRCFKWRTVQSQEEFEEIRSKFIEDPFYCEKKSGFSCDDPSDMEYDSSRTWVIDKPNQPKTPAGFRRGLKLRKDHSKMDVQYITPNGKRLRASTEVAQFLQDNPEFKHLSVSNFSFTSPKVMEDTVPDHVGKKGSAGKNLVLGSA